MLIAVIILGTISFLLILLLFFSRREMDHIVHQLKELSGSDTNALLHVKNGFVSADLLREINSLLAETRANRVHYAQKRHELEQMLTNISHDLRTPLTSALGYLDMIFNSNLPAEEKHRETGIVTQRLERLEELINSFFELSQMIAGGRAPEKEELNLVAVLEESVAHHYDDYCVKGRSVVLQCEKNKLKVFSNQNMLLRIFDNLISNSLKHGVGNLIISVQECASPMPRRDTPKNTAGLASPENLPPTQISVRFENFLVTPCPDLARIFDEFYTTDISRTKGNTGLGLAIAKHFTELLGGKISASYEEGVFAVNILFK